MQADYLYFTDEAQRVFFYDQEKGISPMPEVGEPVISLSFGGGRLWIARADGSIAYYAGDSVWETVTSDHFKAHSVAATRAGNVMVMQADGSMFVYELSGKLMQLAPAGLYADVAAGPEGTLWFVPQAKNDKSLPLMWTTLQELRPQPLSSSVYGTRVAAAGNGKVAFVTLGGEVASCQQNGLASLHSGAGVRFATDLSIQQANGTYFALGLTDGEGDTAPVYAWNQERDKHDAWTELSGVRARSITAG